jgi:outer membrane immunogenic protein
MKLLLSVSAFALASVIGAGASFAADLPDTVIIPAPAMVDVSSDWSGFYAGGHGGAVGDYDIAGWLAGVQIGFNHQMDSIVIGADASIEWDGISGEDDDFPPDAVTRDINWSGAVRGKLGFAVESILIYGAAGLAFANSTADVFSTEDTQTHLGWTVGLGVEAMVTEDVSLFAEYDYTSYGAETYDYGFDVDTSFVTHAVKVGANWHF